MIPPPSSSTRSSPRTLLDQSPRTGTASNSTARPGLEPSASTSSSRSRVFDRLRPWKTTVAGRRKSGLFSHRKENDLVAGDPYVTAAVASSSKHGVGPSTGNGNGHGTGKGSSEEERSGVENGYDWEEDSNGGSGSDAAEPDTYSWVDPSLVGTSALGHSTSGSEHGLRSPGVASSLLDAPLTPVVPPQPTNVSPPPFPEMSRLTSRTQIDRIYIPHNHMICYSPTNPTASHPHPLTLVYPLAERSKPRKPVIAVPIVHNGTNSSTDP